MKYVALLRGINVGGNHLIKMADLKACFEEQRLRDVATYIQSGQVVFTATARPAEIVRRLEAAILREVRLPDQRDVAEPQGDGADRRARAEGLRRPAGEISLRRHLPEPAAHGRSGAGEGRAQAGRRRGARGGGRALFLASDQQGDAEPAAARRLDADLQEHDDPQLAHHHDAAADADGRRRGETDRRRRIRTRRRRGRGRPSCAACARACCTRRSGPSGRAPARRRRTRTGADSGGGRCARRRRDRAGAAT